MVKIKILAYISLTIWMLIIISLNATLLFYELNISKFMIGLINLTAIFFIMGSLQPIRFPSRN